MFFVPALLYCDGLLEGGHSDWRLPTLACPLFDGCLFSEATGEFDSILSLACPFPFVRDTQGQGCWKEEDPFSGVQSDVYWSASTYADFPSDAWYADLESGGGLAVRGFKTSHNYVWPVRGGP